MNKLGNPESTPERKRGGWGMIVAAIAVMIFGVLLVGRFLPVLYAIMFPPSPPRPDTTVELSGDSSGYGADTILYAVPEDGCALVRYYQSQGATCSVAPAICDTGFVQMEQPRPATQVARCNADVPFSIFTMRYRAEIITGYGTQTEGLPTRLRLEREIFWSGAPRDTSELSATLTP